MLGALLGLRLLRGFPRRNRRGLIEAGVISDTGRFPSAVFPGGIAGASLKPTAG